MSNAHFPKWATINLMSKTQSAQIVSNNQYKLEDSGDSSPLQSSQQLLSNVLYVQKMQEIYRNIIRSADAIKQCSSSSECHVGRVGLASVNLNSFSGNPITPHFSPPPDIAKTLNDRGVSLTTAQKLAGSLERAAKAFQARLEAGFYESWSQITQLPRPDSMLPLDQLRSQLSASYEAVYNRRLDSWIKDIRKAALSSKLDTEGSPSHGTEERFSRPAFNSVSSLINHICASILCSYCIRAISQS